MANIKNSVINTKFHIEVTFEFFTCPSGYSSGIVMIGVTAITLKFLQISSSGPWWLTERKFLASEFPLNI